jgi:homoserine kinase
VGGLIAGLYTKITTLGRSLHDEIVEPLRSVLIGFDLIKKTAMKTVL